MEKGNASSLEEKIYWGHFSTFHFAQFLLTDFEDQLDIPEKFTSNLKHKLPRIATLRGPTGVAWNVELVGDGDTLAFKHGWKQFVRDNSLAENDFLMFKYKGESQFDVLMFDACSLCEKEATYFVRESGDAKNVTERQTEGRKETSDEVVLNSSPDGDSLEPKNNNEDDDDDDFTIAKEQNSSLRLSEKEVTKKAQCIQTGRPSKAMVISKPEDLDGGRSYAKRKRGSASAKQYVSKRRPITEEEKKKALEAAKAAANNESAVVIMRPSSVYKKFYAVLPSDWLHKHVHPENQDVILRHENKTWHARFNYVKSRSCGGLSAAGWKDFVVDNNLEEYDVCVFELAPGLNIPLIIDVRIFRVVEDTTPMVGVF